MNKQSSNSKYIQQQATSFQQWYTDVCLQAQLFAYGPVKGTIIFKPYGLQLWNTIKKYLTTQFQQEHVLEVYFPMLIPDHIMQQEISQIKGFAPELLQITKIGDQQLTAPLVLRPTSETLFSLEFQKMVKSYRDLPIKYNQWCSVVRWEKNTRPFLRNSEFLWQEGHTAHRNDQQAMQFTKKIFQIYYRLITKKLLMPIFIGYKTTADTFAGAQKTLTVECGLPNGYALQCATSHFFGQNLAKIFHIQYQNQAQQQQLASSTSWGMSTRILGGLVMTHSDNQGLVLPWVIAPVQVMFILYADDPQLQNYIQPSWQICQAQHYRITCNSNQQDSFGYRIKAAIAQGIPLIVAVGWKNIKQMTFTMIARHQESSCDIPNDHFQQFLTNFVPEYNACLQQKAATAVHNKTVTVYDWVEFQQQSKQALFMKTVFCGLVSCETKLRELTKLRPRCLLTSEDLVLQPVMDGKCFFCQKQPAFWTLFAKAY